MHGAHARKAANLNFDRLQLESLCSPQTVVVVSRQWQVERLPLDCEIASPLPVRFFFHLHGVFPSVRSGQQRLGDDPFPTQTAGTVANLVRVHAPFFFFLLSPYFPASMRAQCIKKKYSSSLLASFILRVSF